MITTKLVGKDGLTYEVIYLTRADWGSKSVQVLAGYAIPLSQFVGWVLHHTVMIMPDYDRDGYLKGDLDDVKRYMRVLQTARPDLGSEVPYSFVIFHGSHERQVIICEGRGFGRSGAHTAGLNSTRYAWSVAGDLRVEPVTSGMIQGMRWLAATNTPWVTIPTIGHRQAPPYFQNGVNLNATACPTDTGIAATHLLQPPFKLVEPKPKEWDEMATEAQIRAIVKDEITKATQPIKDELHDLKVHATNGKSEQPPDRTMQEALGAVARKLGA